ncbi:uncharacterized protein B0P05DRAFT_508468 [Gilbertella persicaria]|uniref:uncharacterized protein n=1 Tax=Gilbertella persicaria TaxID=101096 RepID=UPI0022204951|nr:uncharacterized protein B0P05DRAFT_508468 [Gilbertella persicaria]KAI8082616.1 hypothetical protein B0P05DRAFT_508468 [Gilbertella persicaria]
MPPFVTVLKTFFSYTKDHFLEWVEYFLETIVEKICWNLTGSRKNIVSPENENRTVSWC